MAKKKGRPGRPRTNDGKIEVRGRLDAELLAQLERYRYSRSLTLVDGLGAALESYPARAKPTLRPIPCGRVRRGRPRLLTSPTHVTARVHPSVAERVRRAAQSTSLNAVLNDAVRRLVSSEVS